MLDVAHARDPVVDWGERAPTAPSPLSCPPARAAEFTGGMVAIQEGLSKLNLNEEEVGVGVMGEVVLLGAYRPSMSCWD